MSKINDEKTFAGSTSSLRDRKKEKDILKILKNFHKKDFEFSSGKIFSSMCTSPHKIAKKAWKIFDETNLGDNSISQGASEIEKECIKICGKLLNLDQPYGVITSGGTESNILAILEARARKLNGLKLTNNQYEPKSYINFKRTEEIIVPKTAHFSFDKISFLMKIKVKKAKVNENFEVDVNDVKRLITKNTIAIVGIVGNTEYGAIDDINALSEISKENDLFLHVDAAYGGFVVPFMRELNYDVPDFDFKIKGVDSISLDPHKMGLSVIPSGMLLFRETPKFSVEVPYLSGRQRTLLGTRPAGSAAATYAVLKFLSFEGYKKIVKRCMENTKYMANGLKNLNLEVLNYKMNILNFKLPEEIFEKINQKWKISKTSNGYARVVIMPHIKRRHIDEFLSDLQKNMAL